MNVGGTWIGRQPAHSSEEDALGFVRSKAFRSEREMRQVQLGLPAAVGGTTVTGSGLRPPVVPFPGPASGPSTPIPPHRAFGPILPQNVIPSITGSVQVFRADEETIGINLSACFETWGVDASAVLEAAEIKFSNLTVQQFRQVLAGLPSSLKATMEVTLVKEEGAQ